MTVLKALLQRLQDHAIQHDIFDCQLAALGHGSPRAPRTSRATAVCSAVPRNKDERELIGPRRLRNLRGKEQKLTGGDGYIKTSRTCQAVSTESTLGSTRLPDEHFKNTSFQRTEKTKIEQTTRPPSDLLHLKEQLKSKDTETKISASVLEE